MGNRQGYPSIESLKYLSELFHVSIDELVSHEDIANKAAFDKKASQKYYIASIACWIFTVGCALAAYLTGNQYWGIGCGAGIVGYIFFASIFSYKRRRIKAGKELRSFIAIRVVILLVLLAITAGFFFKIG